MEKTPKLRFKEFSGDWNKTNIGNEFNLSSGTTPSKSNKEYFNGSNCWVTSGELKKKYINSTIDKISDKALEECNLKKYPIGTFTIAIYGLEASGTRGSCSILNTEATISQACMAFTPKLNTSSEFMYYWYMKYGEKIGIKYAQGTKQQNLSTYLVSNINISVPSKEEQDKISSFLSLIDDKISLQGEKVDALKDYKKGMMQKLFSGELRFKDDEGRDYPEWETHLLGKSIILYDNLRKPVKEQERSSGKYAYYGATGIIDYINDYIFEGEYLLLGEDGVNIVTRNAPLIYKTNGKFWVNNHAHIFKPTSEFDIDFMKQCLERINYVPYNTGTAQPKLNVESIKSIPFKAPTLEEQKKIAKLLINIDLKVEKEQEKLDSLKEYKKGLLQQMFV